MYKIFAYSQRKRIVIDTSSPMLRGVRRPDDLYSPSSRHSYTINKQKETEERAQQTLEEELDKKAKIWRTEVVERRKGLPIEYFFKKKREIEDVLEKITKAKDKKEIERLVTEILSQDLNHYNLSYLLSGIVKTYKKYKYTKEQKEKIAEIVFRYTKDLQEIQIAGIIYGLKEQEDSVEVRVILNRISEHVKEYKMKFTGRLATNLCGLKRQSSKEGLECVEAVISHIGSTEDLDLSRLALVMVGIQSQEDSEGVKKITQWVLEKIKKIPKSGRNSEVNSKDISQILFSLKNRKDSKETEELLEELYKLRSRCQALSPLQWGLIGYGLQGKTKSKGVERWLDVIAKEMQKSRPGCCENWTIAMLTYGLKDRLLGYVEEALVKEIVLQLKAVKEISLKHASMCMLGIQKHNNEELKKEILTILKEKYSNHQVEELGEDPEDVLEANEKISISAVVTALKESMHLKIAEEWCDLLVSRISKKDGVDTDHISFLLSKRKWKEISEEVLESIESETTLDEKQIGIILNGLKFQNATSGVESLIAAVNKKLESYEYTYISANTIAMSLFGLRNYTNFSEAKKCIQLLLERINVEEKWNEIEVANSFEALQDQKDEGLLYKMIDKQLEIIKKLSTFEVRHIVSIIRSVEGHVPSEKIDALLSAMLPHIKKMKWVVGKNLEQIMRALKGQTSDVAERILKITIDKVLNQRILSDAMVKRGYLIINLEGVKTKDELDAIESRFKRIFETENAEILGYKELLNILESEEIPGDLVGFFIKFASNTVEFDRLKSNLKIIKSSEDQFLRLLNTECLTTQEQQELIIERLKRGVGQRGLAQIEKKRVKEYGEIGHCLTGRLIMYVPSRCDGIFDLEIGEYIKNIILARRDQNIGIVLLIGYNRKKDEESKMKKLVGSVDETLRLKSLKDKKSSVKVIVYEYEWESVAGYPYGLMRTKLLDELVGIKEKHKDERWKQIDQKSALVGLDGDIKMTRQAMRYLEGQLKESLTTGKTGFGDTQFKLSEEDENAESESDAQTALRLNYYIEEQGLKRKARINETCTFVVGEALVKAVLEGRAEVYPVFGDENTTYMKFLRSKKEDLGAKRIQRPSLLENDVRVELRNYETFLVRKKPRSETVLEYFSRIRIQRQSMANLRGLSNWVGSMYDVNGLYVSKVAAVLDWKRVELYFGRSYRSVEKMQEALIKVLLDERDEYLSKRERREFELGLGRLKQFLRREFGEDRYKKVVKKVGAASISCARGMANILEGCEPLEKKWDIDGYLGSLSQVESIAEVMTSEEEVEELSVETVDVDMGGDDRSVTPVVDSPPEPKRRYLGGEGEYEGIGGGERDSDEKDGEEVVSPKGSKKRRREAPSEKGVEKDIEEKIVEVIENRQREEIQALVRGGVERESLRERFVLAQDEETGEYKYEEASREIRQKLRRKENRRENDLINTFDPRYLGQHHDNVGKKIEALLRLGVESGVLNPEQFSLLELLEVLQSLVASVALTRGRI